MSDGEQQKGQVGEARRLAAKYDPGNITAIVDWNGIQISGATSEIMPVPLVADWQADGWRVIECDGHDLAALHEAIAEAVSAQMPCVVLAHTVIGKGVSFMEGEAEFHGRGLTVQEYATAMGELGHDAVALDRAREARGQSCTVERVDCTTPAVPLSSGAARTYESGSKLDNRSAWGKALVDLVDANPQVATTVLDCDLAVSVKTGAFASAHPQGFVECGVGEHNAATISGALSTVPGVLAFWADFGVFGIDEVYNQQRLNDINHTAVKLAVTHCGLDVGEDGRTHHCLDYVGALRGLYGWRVIVPADPNQTDRAVRVAAAMQGNVAIAMGRSALPVIEDGHGAALFGGDYQFVPGTVDWAREGGDGVMLAMGTVAGAAVAASDELRRQGVEVAVGIVAMPLEIPDAALRKATSSRLVFTAEDHCSRTGLGASVAEWMAAHPTGARLVRVGVEGYRTSGLSSELLAREGLDAGSLALRVRGELQSAGGR